MKKTGVHLLFTTLAVLLLCCALCLFAAAEERTITLDVQNGQDISAAFNKAADTVRYNDGETHLTIVIPAGSYQSGANLRLYSHTTVQMDGATIVHTDSASTMLRLGRRTADWEEANDGAGHPGYSGFCDIAIEGGTWNGGGKQQAIMRFGHSSDITLRGVTFCNVKNAHMVELGGCKDVLIEGCTFSSFRGNWDATTNYEALQMEIVSTQGSHFGGYNPDNDETPCEKITVTGCTFKNLQRGVGTHSGIAGSFFSNISITDNTFVNITGFAVIATNYADSTVSRNRISRCGAGILMRTVELSHNNFYRSAVFHEKQTDYPLLGCTIADNRISITPGYQAQFSTFTYGIQLTGELLKKRAGSTPAGDYRIADVRVSGNVIKLNGAGYAVWLNGAAENRVEKNQITVTVQGEHNTAGILLQKSTANRLLNNQIKFKYKTEYSDVCGVMLQDQSEENLVYKNNISAARKDGIFLRESNGCVIRANTVSASGRDGIHLEQSSALTILSNSVKGSGRNGIFSNGITNSKYQKNSISRA